MFSQSCRYIVGVSSFLVLTAQAHGQEKVPPKKAEEAFRQYFKNPETAQEFWAALKFEIGVGKFDMAAADLKGFLAKKPSDQELLQLEEDEGMSAFLRLLTIPELRADAGPLVERVSEVVRKHRGDPERIKKLIRNLNATPEEREYAVGELRRSGAAAMPYLVDALRDSRIAAEHKAIWTALLLMPREAMPPLWAALDTEDAGLQLDLLELFQQRREAGAVPFLWFTSASPTKPEIVRAQARQTLSILLATPPERLPPAKVALTLQADKYYRHQARFTDPRAETIWEWKGNHLVAQTVNASQAEEYYGLRFARQALALDSGFEPAQVVFLSTALDKGFEKVGLDQPLEKGAPAVKELLKIVNPELLYLVLDRALAEQRVPVMIGAVRALGDLPARAGLQPLTEKQPALVRALFYSDRRVQLAAADSLLRIRGSAASLHAARIVEVLRRAAAADSITRVLVVDPNSDRGHDVARALKSAGVDAVTKATGREALLRLGEAADIDMLFIDANVPYPMLPYLLSQLRSDANYGLLPIVITIPPDASGKVSAEARQRLERLVAAYRTVWVEPTTMDKDYLLRTVLTKTSEAFGKPLTEAERKANAALAMVWLKRLAVGEAPGFDVRSAEGAIFKALRNDDLALLAIEASGHLPGRDAQRALADVVLTNPRPELRSAAAVELARHIEQHDLALANSQVHALEALYAATGDSKLRGSYALVMGSLHPDRRLTGARLQGYNPPITSPMKPEVKEK